MGGRDYNPFISFYGEHCISPVHQDISDFRAHLARREKLYRLLGMPPAVFTGKTILEVGPGGGYNTLAFFNWGADVDFVEPNSKAQEEIPVLLNQYGIGRERWTLFPDKIEKFNSGKKYDVVIAEGFIPGLYNISEVVSKIAGLVNPGGVAVVTCIDDISFFFENVKRLVATRLIQEATDFNEKIQILARAFASHLRCLKHASRPVEDWVTDQFLNPALYANLFSIEDCVREFGEEFAFLGSSPSMFTDYSWYKDLEFDSREAVVNQFRRKRHLLILWDLDESLRSTEDNDALFKAVCELRAFSGKIGDDLDKQNIEIIVGLLRRIAGLTQDIDPRIPEAIDEAIALLSDKNLDEVKVSKASRLAAAFGRGQQYVSMVRGFAS
ncbi:MAG: methyltransferase domain-containing protein [Bacillota bacterium]